MRRHAEEATVAGMAGKPIAVALALALSLTLALAPPAPASGSGPGPVGTAKKKAPKCKKKRKKPAAGAKKRTCKRKRIAPTNDTDGDGLPNQWEKKGSPQGAPLPLYGANPRHKDIFVELYYDQA